MKRAAVFAILVAGAAIAGTAWAGKDRAIAPLRLQLDLADGSVIIGVPSIDSVRVQTSYAKMDIPLKQLVAVRIGDDHETAVIDLQNGDKLKGVIDLESVKLEALFGKVSIDVGNIRSLTVIPGRGMLPESVQKGLKVWYGFDSDGDDCAVDKSGSKNNGVMKGAKWIPGGKVGGGCRLAGGTDHISIDGRDLRKSSDDNFSVGAWFYAERFNPDDENVVFCISAPRGTDDGAFAYGICVSPKSDHALTFLSGSFCQVNSASPMVTGMKEQRWYHVVGVVDCGEVRLYVDGAEAGRVRYSLPPTRVSAVFDGCVGNTHGMLTTRGFNGVLDEVIFIDRALTGDEIRQIYDSQK